MNSMKLIMAMVVKNEEDLIEKNIRFHCAMGVDGVIVTSHNSTDSTNEILEKLKQEGLVLEIIYKSSPLHEHHVWVNQMVKIARKKYKADWILNADADEFYYSKDLNLKKSIYKYSSMGYNVIWVDSIFSFPEDDCKDLENKLFITGFIPDFQREIILKNKDIPFYTRKLKASCPKVIHTTRDFKSATDGNHWVKMYKHRQVESININLYHYNCRNYKSYEAKAKRWMETSRLLPDKKCPEKHIISLYESGKLKEHYDKEYSKEVLSVMINCGAVTTDKSVADFLKYKKIID